MEGGERPIVGMLEATTTTITVEVEVEVEVVVPACSAQLLLLWELQHSTARARPAQGHRRLLPRRHRRETITISQASLIFTRELKSANSSVLTRQMKFQRLHFPTWLMQFSLRNCQAQCSIML